MHNKLYRSSTDKMVGGVCGGLAAYLHVNVMIVRLVFLLLGLTNGVGLTIYLVLWIIMPYEGGTMGARDTARTSASEISRQATSMANDVRDAVRDPNPNAAILIGGGLIVWGWIALLRNLNIPWLSWLRFDVLWPGLLILAGAALLVRFLQEKTG